ncbi:MAG: carotenoid biosynthesis protein [Proteobacteria bacterium]|nr:carotenoid biosynthesis protein [Pseudomonadota bacterium]
MSISSFNAKHAPLAPQAPGLLPLTSKSLGALWAIAALALAIAAFAGAGISARFENPAFVVLALTCVAFVFLHGMMRYSLKVMLVFLVITSFWALFWENLSVFTGFPFGWYHYDDSFGPKLLQAPYFLTVAYFQYVYLAWTMAHIVLGRYTNKIEGAWTFVLPLVATFIIVMFDNVFDPYNSTMVGHYVWHSGGAYFGVPFSNYLGWYLCTWTMFQSFALYKHWTQTRSEPEPTVLFEPSYWLANVATYLSWLVLFLVKGFTVDPTITLHTMDGLTWNEAALLQTAGIIGIATMGFIALLSLLKILALREVPQNHRR